MSTLTSLVKSGKRKIIKTKVGQLLAEHERDGIETRQKALETSGSRASIETALGRPDQRTSLDPTRPQPDTETRA